MFQLRAPQVGQGSGRNVVATDDVEKTSGTVHTLFAILAFRPFSALPSTISSSVMSLPKVKAGYRPAMRQSATRFLSNRQR